MRSDEDHLRMRHMLDAAKAAVALSRGKGPKALAKDRMRSLAMVRLLLLRLGYFSGFPRRFRTSSPCSRTHSSPFEMRRARARGIENRPWGFCWTRTRLGLESYFSRIWKVPIQYFIRSDYYQH